jgi:protein-disulfide isomerase
MFATFPLRAAPLRPARLHAARLHAARLRAASRAATLAVATTLGLALPAAALDLTAMTDAERAAFRDEVRAYLMDNPEVLMEAIGVLEDRQSADQAAADIAILRANADDLLANPTSWAGGNPDGDTTLVEFMDYRCGYCRRAHEDVNTLVETDGNLRYVIKEFPILGPDSLASSRFALSVRALAGDDAYKAAHNALIALEGPANPRALRGIAEAIGVDADAAIAGMEAPEVDAIIAANRALADRLGLNGTPSFVIHETMVRGYVPLDGMRQIVAGQRAAMARKN